MSSTLARMVAGLADAGLAVRTDAPFGALTTYAVGGHAAVMVEVTGADDVSAVASLTSKHPGIDVFVLGNGSNTLVADGGFDGLVVRLRPPADPDAARVTVSDGLVEVQSWMPLPVLARRSVAAGGCGLEWAVGVPGTVGGAVRMNAGGHGAETVDTLESAEVVSLRSGARKWLAADLLGLHFRGSGLTDWQVVTSARFRVSDPHGHACADEIAEIVAWRREHQPGGRNAGSVFVNPAPGDGSSGALIDSCGLRGVSIGGATVSDKHANFVQAGPGASASDVLGLMMLVQDRVLAATGRRLASETRLVGFPPADTARFRREDGAGPSVALARALGEVA
ncbi:MAG: UDP-N-acetylenolpyruvoylglucosamine reductase [Actinomycetota bacterium]|jgi:UDP-N-acetylmuramate dehydrogenase